jgi:pyrroloquinoline quinone biosynthesis protein B
VLGTAAGGGLPQWNCACVVCDGARRDGTSRTQDCLAISADGTGWYLVNASPDIRAQILAAPELAPGPARRQTPLRGVLFTSAELDHTLGLVALREAADFTVYGTATVLSALPMRPLVEPYGGFSWSTVDVPTELGGGLSVEAVPVSRKRPRYAVAAGLADAADWVVAYRFTDRRTGGVFVYAPGLPAWTAEFAAALHDAACVMLDGSFFTDDEMAVRAGGGPAARQMGHLPIEDSLPRRAEHPAVRWLYTHLNNTNPVLVTGSPEHRAVVAAGAEVAADTMVLDL